MYKKLLITFQVIFIAFTGLGEVKALSREIILNNNFDGYWIGKSKIIVAWSEKKQISFSLQIHENGSVTGTIGDSTIKNGKIKLNHILLRLIGNKEYIIDATLSDYLVKSEKIKRKSIRIFLDYKKSFLTGGFHTSGSKFGGKEKMVFSGTKLKLSKTKPDK